VKRTGSSAPATSQEAWPGVAPNGLTPRGSEPQWNADRRARFAKRAPRPLGAEVGLRVCRRSASLLLLLFRRVVLSEAKPTRLVRFGEAQLGHVASLFCPPYKEWRLQNSGAQRAARTYSLIRPREAGEGDHAKHGGGGL